MPGVCTFNDEWTTEDGLKDWVARDPTDNHKAMCLVCRKSFVIQTMGKAALLSHAKGAKHLSLLSHHVKKGPKIDHYFIDSDTGSQSSSPSTSIASSGNIIPTGSLSIQQFASGNKELSAEVLWAINVVQKHQSFRSCEGIAALFSSMFPDSSIASKFTCSKSKCAYLTTFGIAPYFKSLIVAKVKLEKNYVLLFDEAMNSQLQTKQLDILVERKHVVKDSKCDDIIRQFKDFSNESRTNSDFTSFVPGTARLDTLMHSTMQRGRIGLTCGVSPKSCSYYHMGRHQ